MSSVARESARKDEVHRAEVAQVYIAFRLTINDPTTMFYDI